MVGNNATISVATRAPRDGEASNGVIITTSSGANDSNNVSNGESEAGVEQADTTSPTSPSTATSTGTQPTTGTTAPTDRGRAGNRQRGGPPETINLTTYDV